MITQNIVLHLAPYGVRPRVYLSQYDTGLEKLKFHLVDGNTYYDIPDGTQVLFIGTKSDCKMFSYACTWEGHTVTLDVTEQMTAVKGYVDCELRLIDSSSNCLGSINIDLWIEASPYENGVVSCNDFRSADEEILSIHQEVEVAGDLVEKASGYEESVRTAAKEAVDEINDLLEEAHGYIENGFVINYYDDHSVIELTN